MPPKKPAKRDRSLLIEVTSDQHAGGTTAVCPPSIALDDGGHYAASKAQQWMYEHWKAFHKRGDELRHALNDPILGQVYNGDFTDGDHHGTTQILSGNPTAQAAVVNELMRVPLAQKPDFICGIRGTEAHVGRSASSEERIFTGLRKDGWPVVCDEATGNASHWSWTMEHQGQRINFAHHGKFGSRPSTKMNTVVALAFDIFTEHALDGRPHPHLAVRSHMHQFGDTGNIYPTRLIQMPAWQLATAFIQRINTTGKLADVGGIFITVVDGEIDVIPYIAKPAEAPAWRAA